eukprot:4393159-Amphidinium_carterae.1
MIVFCPSVDKGHGKCAGSVLEVSSYIEFATIAPCVLEVFTANTLACSLPREDDSHATAAVKMIIDDPESCTYKAQCCCLLKFPRACRGQLMSSVTAVLMTIDEIIQSKYGQGTHAGMSKLETPPTKGPRQGFTAPHYTQVRKAVCHIDPIIHRPNTSMCGHATLMQDVQEFLRRCKEIDHSNAGNTGSSANTDLEHARAAWVLSLHGVRRGARTHKALALIQTGVNSLSD